MSDACCGIEAYRRTEIIGGFKTGPREFPWAVRLSPGCARSKCGGVLVSHRIVLSAYHCAIRPYDLTKICDHSDGSRRAYFGIYEFEDEEAHTYYSISIIDAIAPKHHVPDESLEMHDFIIFILKTSVTYSITVRPICLPEQYEDFYNFIAEVAGWGMFEVNSTMSSVLRKTPVRVVQFPNKHCKMTSTVVTLNKEGLPQDPCAGDSGLYPNFMRLLF